MRWCVMLANHGNLFTDCQGPTHIAFSSAVVASSNPFWHNGKLDVPTYFRLNKLPVPDAVSILLGDNDLAGAKTDELAAAKVSLMSTDLKVLVSALKAAGVKHIGIALTPVPGSQDGFGEDYGLAIHGYRLKRAMLQWVSIAVY